MLDEAEFWLAYGGIGFLVGCRVAALFAWEMARRTEESRYRSRGDIADAQPAGDQWFGAGAFGMLIAAPLWPLALMAMTMHQILLPMPKDIQHAKDKKRIAELERELDVK